MTAILEIVLSVFKGPSEIRPKLGELGLTRRTHGAVGGQGAGVMTEPASNTVSSINHLPLPQQEAHTQEHTRRPSDDSLTETCFSCPHAEDPEETLQTQILNAEWWRFNGSSGGEEAYRCLPLHTVSPPPPPDPANS